MRQTVKRIAASQAANQPYAPAGTARRHVTILSSPRPSQKRADQHASDKLERRRRWSRLGPDCRSGYFTPGSVGDLGTVEGR
jgi:hypothetical protein